MKQLIPVRFFLSKTGMLPACLTLAAAFFLYACDSMESIHKEFIHDEIVYPAKADSLLAASGNYRVMLSWLPPSDPTVSRARIFWNNRRDSLDAAIERTSNEDRIQVLISGLEERSYTFEVYTLDNEGNISVKSEVLGNVYGEIYQQSLYNRLTGKLVHAGETLTLHWQPAEAGTAGQEVTFTDLSGNIHVVPVPATADSTLLPAIDLQKELTFQTLFIPELNAVDTFRTEPQTISIPSDLRQIMLDKALFRAFPLPTDTYEPYSSANNSMDKIWDGILNKDAPTFLTAPGSGLPQWFTVDLGKAVRLSKVRMHQRGNRGGTAQTRLYEGGNLRKWEIWGSASPNPDGSWDDSWTLLQVCESIKPSGSPSGTLTEADIQHAVSGEDYDIPAQNPVRYIRIKALQNWDSLEREYVNIGQITLWGE